MIYLKRYNEHKEISIFDPSWTKFLPDKLKIITTHGERELALSKEKSSLGHAINISNLFNSINIPYFHKTYEKPEDCLDDGEPDYLCFDLTFTKENSGHHSDPDNLKLGVDITYGDAMVAGFTIKKPNKVKLFHYTGKHSKHDKHTKFAFCDESLKKLVDLFNRFGYELKMEDFKFLDSDHDSYKYTEPKIKGHNVKTMSFSHRKDVENLKGGDKVTYVK